MFKMNTTYTTNTYEILNRGGITHPWLLIPYTNLDYV